MKKLDTATVAKVVGIAGTVVGLAGTLMSNWAGEKKTDETIAKKVAEALAKSQTEES